MWLVRVLAICCTGSLYVQCCAYSVFTDTTGITDMVCPEADVVFAETIPSLIWCSARCKKESACFGVFYSENDHTCTGCRNNYVDTTTLENSPGTVYFKKPACYDPIPTPDAEAVISLPNGPTNIGVSITYSCQPCSFYPADGQNTVTCNELGQWSGAPRCVYGPDTNTLQSGAPIPPGSLGCDGQCGPFISNGLQLQGGSTGCYCDKVCCEYNDCCYDVPLCP